MPVHIADPTRITAAGNKPKQIEEFVGRVNSGHPHVSMAQDEFAARLGGAWPEARFEEISIVLSGMLRVEHEGGAFEVAAGQAVVCKPGEWVRYSTPQGAEYVAICLPAFSPDTVHRDANS